MSVRVARNEVRLQSLMKQLQAYIESNEKRADAERARLDQLDQRIDRNDVLLARLAAFISLAFLAAQIVAPYLLHLLGAPPG